MFGEKILIIFTWVSRFNLSSLLAYMHTLDFAMHTLAKLFRIVTTLGRRGVADVSACSRHQEIADEHTVR
jgi:hypothetical protein